MTRGAPRGSSWEKSDDCHPAQWPNHCDHRLARVAPWCRAIRRLTLLMAVIAFVVLGIAVTLGAILLIVIPVAIGVGIIASLFQPRPR